MSRTPHRPVRLTAATVSLAVAFSLASLATTVALASTSVAVQATAKKPDLTVTSTSLSTTLVVAGSSLTVSATVKNAGTKKAAASTLGLWLSKDKKRSSHDVSLGTRSVAALAAGKHVAVSKKVTVSKRAAAGSWHVVACADIKKKVTEKSESNNCRATGTLKVVAPGYFPQKPAPLTVTPTFAAVTYASGQYADAYADDDNTFTATAPDGTTYTLAVPAKAVNRSVVLTVSALTGLTGAPTSLISGVRLEPTGLQLSKNATLTITPGAAYPAAGVTAFRFFDGGSDAGMYPIQKVDATTHAITLSIGELGTYAVGNSTAAQRTIARSHPPTRTLGQLFNVLGDLHKATTARRIAGTAPPPITDVAASDAYYDTVLHPLLVAAEKDEDLARTVVPEALTWAHLTAVLGGTDNPRVIDATIEMLKAMTNAVKQEYTRCRTQHSIVDLGELLVNARRFAILGAPGDAQSADDKAHACGRFTLSFDDRITSQQSYPAGGTAPTSQGFDFNEFLEVGTAQPITMTLNQFGVFSGTGTLVYKRHSYTAVNTYPDPGSCTLTTTTTITKTTDGATDGTTATLGVDLLWNPQDYGPGVVKTPPADGLIYTSFTGAMPGETVHVQDSGCSSSSSTYTDTKWALDSHHYPGGGGAALVIPIKRSEQLGATLFNHTYTWDNGGKGDIHSSHDTERTVVQIQHVPQ